MSTFDRIFDEVKEREPNVREISYDQFMQIKNSGEPYKLVDVLSRESYESGHIEDAISLPLSEICPECVEKILSKDDRIITYCGGFRCTMSTDATRKLSEMGYKVLDFKGGLEEWQKRGHELAVFHR